MTGPSPEQPEPIDAEIVEPVEPAPVQPPAPDYDERGVPSFDHVRDRIEGRYATALGGTELAEGTSRTLDEQQAERERAAAARLAEIRRQLDGS